MAKRFIQFERARNAKNNIERDKYDYRIVEAFKKAGGQTGFLDQKTLEELSIKYKASFDEALKK